MKAAGLEAFRESVESGLPFRDGRAAELGGWDQVKLLSVQMNRLETWWRPGLLCIGDAAHAMSPVGGVGVNLAVQDAVAVANALAEPLRRGAVDDGALRAVQRRREWPTRATQRLQALVQDRVLLAVLRGGASFKAPAALRVMSKVPLLRDLPGRIVGMGIRRERLRAPAVP